VYLFDTVKPGQVEGPGGKKQAPHIVVALFGRGMLRQVYTRLYFEGDPANAADPILNLVPVERRATLMAKKDGDVWRWDVHMQGDKETVFFDV
jgi:protocatechuate 3,4-dioxygenase alpha subunit